MSATRLSASFSGISGADLEAELAQLHGIGRAAAQTGESDRQDAYAARELHGAGRPRTTGDASAADS